MTDSVSVAKPVVGEEIKDTTADALSKLNISGTTVTFTVADNGVGGKSHVITVQDEKLCVDGTPVPIAAWEALDDDQKNMFGDDEGAKLRTAYEAATSLAPAKLRANLHYFFADEDRFPDIAGDGTQMQLMDAIAIRVATGQPIASAYTVDKYTLTYDNIEADLPSTGSELMDFDFDRILALS